MNAQMLPRKSISVKWPLIFTIVGLVLLVNPFTMVFGVAAIIPSLIILVKRVLQHKSETPNTNLKQRKVSLPIVLGMIIGLFMVGGGIFTTYQESQPGYENMFIQSGAGILYSCIGIVIVLVAMVGFLRHGRTRQ